MFLITKGKYIKILLHKCKNEKKKPLIKYYILKSIYFYWFFLFSERFCPYQPFTNILIWTSILFLRFLYISFYYSCYCYLLTFYHWWKNEWSITNTISNYSLYWDFFINLTSSIYQCVIRAGNLLRFVFLFRV